MLIYYKKSVTSSSTTVCSEHVCIDLLLEGSDIYPLKSSWDRYTILTFLIYSVLAALAFAIALRYKDIHESIESRIRKRKQLKFIFQTFDDISEAEDSFTKDTRSIKFISTEKWKSYPYPDKFLIFNSLEDYLRIDRFYTGLEKRNLLLSGKDIPERDMLDINKECAGLARNALTNIKWATLGLKTKLDLVLVVPSIILGALFILYICEGIPISVYSHDFGEEASPIPVISMSQFMQGTVALLFIFIILLARSASSMLMAILINKISHFPQNINAQDRYNIKRLFLLSIFIVGIPTSFIMAQLLFFFGPDNTELSVYLEPNIYYLNNPIDLPLIYILIDIARLSILVWITTKPFVKRKLINQPSKVLGLSLE